MGAGICAVILCQCKRSSEYDVSTDDLFIKEVFVNPGPVLKRIRPRARGRADRVLKRTSHITVVLSDEMKKKG